MSSFTPVFLGKEEKESEFLTKDEMEIVGDARTMYVYQEAVMALDLDEGSILDNAVS